MPINWPLTCYGCHLTGSAFVETVVLWTFATSGTTIGLCLPCLNLWLDDVDGGTCDEAAALVFLVATERLMASA